MSQASVNNNSTLLRDVLIFDGQSDRLVKGHILVKNGIIESISSKPIKVLKSVDIIEGKGHFVMPGMIDTHVHLTMMSLTMAQLADSDEMYLALIAEKDIFKILMQGFTTVRDVGGPCFGLKKAIDEDLIPGPRVYPSGAFISQTSGHGDFRSRSEKHRRFGGHSQQKFETTGHVVIADGVDEVLAATRENLRLGATQIKLGAGGGVISPYDPLDVNQYLESELQAAVCAAADWGTYVTVHVMNSNAMNRAINAGVKCIEHGFLCDETTMKLISEKGIFLSTQVVMLNVSHQGVSKSNLAKQQIAKEGLEKMMNLAKKYNTKVVFGTDFIFNSQLLSEVAQELLLRLKWFSPIEVLRQATSVAGELLALSGMRNPYGKLGVIEEGAMADILMIKSNPFDDMNVFKDYQKNLLLIMKNGKIYKNIL